MNGPEGAAADRAALRLPPLHVLATDAELARPDFPRLAAELRRACGAALALHLRTPRTGGRRLYDLAADLAGQARRWGGWCVVNERVDVALAAGVQAVQLGSHALPPREARRLVPRGTAIGVSVHDAAGARDARASGANYLVAGTVYRSATHPDRAPAGAALIEACAAAGPVVAIGGVRPERVAEVTAAGASGVAVVRFVWGADDPVAAALRLVRALGRAGLGPAEGRGER